MITDYLLIITDCEMNSRASISDPIIYASITNLQLQLVLLHIILLDASLKTIISINRIEYCE